MQPALNLANRQTVFVSELREDLENNARHAFQGRQDPAPLVRDHAVMDMGTQDAQRRPLNTIEAPPMHRETPRETPREIPRETHRQLPGAGESFEDGGPSETRRSRIANLTSGITRIVATFTGTLALPTGALWMVNKISQSQPLNDTHDHGMSSADSKASTLGDITIGLAATTLGLIAISACASKIAIGTSVSPERRPDPEN